MEDVVACEVRSVQIRDPEDHARHRSHQGGAAEEAVPRQPESVARLGLRGGLRGGDVDDAAAGQARRLRAGDGGLALGGGVSGGVLRLRGAQLEGPCGHRPQVRLSPHITRLHRRFMNDLDEVGNE